MCALLDRRATSHRTGDDATVCLVRLAVSVYEFFDPYSEKHFRKDVLMAIQHPCPQPPAIGSNLHPS
jgi:hypothetical protein